MTLTRRAWLAGAVALLSGEARAAEGDYAVAEAYTRLRGRALALRPADVGGGEPPGGVFGALMETGYPEAIATLLALADGTASLYFSNGGGVIGAGEHPRPGQAARELLAVAARALAQLAPAPGAPLPRRAHVRFYALTARGPLTAEALERDLREGRHALSPLFAAGHEVIAAIRQHSLKRTQ